MFGGVRCELSDSVGLIVVIVFVWWFRIWVKGKFLLE